MDNTSLESRNRAKWSQLKSEWFTTCTSEIEFIENFYKYYSDDNIKVNDLYYNMLKQLEQKIFVADLAGFQMLIDFIRIIRNSNQEIKFSFPDNTPFRCSDLVISSCLNNTVIFLEYVLEKMDILSECLGHNNSAPEDQDEAHHNAFYYAIRSNNSKLLETLITKWPNNYFDCHEEILEDLIETAYHDLILKNVYLTDETRLFVEGKLLDLRFFSKSIGKASVFVTINERNDQLTDTIKKKIRLIVDNINVLEDMTCNVDEKFIYIAKFLAKIIFALKRLLKVSYDEIPWEEIEFCLLCFIISKTKCNKLNMYYCETLPVDKMIAHLKKFSNKLGQLNISNENKSQKLPQSRRNDIIIKIIKRDPQFADLYDDYKLIRDVTSLEIIKEYASVASKSDPDHPEGQLVLIRALVVMGEHLKDTLESPKLSETTSELLLVSLPKSTADILKGLRNSLTHGHTIGFRNAMEGMSFANIKHDFDKICVIVGDIRLNHENQYSKRLLEKIISAREIEDLEHIFELHQKLQDCKIYTQNISDLFEELELKSEISPISAEHSNKDSKTEKVLDRLVDLIHDQRLRQQINNLRYLFNSDRNINIKRLDLKYTGADSDYIKRDKNLLRECQFTAKQMLRVDKQDSRNMFHKSDVTTLMKLLQVIIAGADAENIDEIMTLSMQLFQFIELKQNDVKFLTEFHDMLKYYKFIINEYDCQKEEIVNYDKVVVLNKKLAQIKHHLHKNGLMKFSNGKFSSYKQNINLRIVLEMLLLDTLSILEKSKTKLNKNFHLFDQKVPTLFGIPLRNHLAHVNQLVHVVWDDVSFIVLQNCQKMIKEDLVSDRRLSIGKVTEYQKVEESFKCDLELLDLQHGMFTSVAKGDLSELKCFIERGADIHGRDMNMKTTVHHAARCWSSEILKYLISEKVAVNVDDVYGQNPLHISVSSGCLSTTEYLIREKLIHINSTDNFKRTPLHIASKEGHTDIVCFLLANGANKSLVDFKFKSPLHKAVEHDHVEVTKILLGRDSTESNVISGGFTLIHYAAECGSFEVLKLLLLHKANVNAKTERNSTPLHLASINGHTNAVRALIQAGADINARDVNGGSPLHNAVETGCDDIVEILLQNGASVTVTCNSAKLTPLHFAVFGETEYILKMLLENDADVNAANYLLQTPLYFAAKKGNLNMVTDLLDFGANINAKDCKGHSALHVAINKVHRDVVEILLTKGININSRTSDGFTSLHFSAMKGNAEISQLLIQSGASIESRDKHGRLPIHLAAQGGNVGVIDLFVKNGSSINARDNEGSTPIFLAILSSNLDATKYFLESKAQILCCNDKKMTPLLCAISKSDLNIVNMLLDYEKDLINASCSNITPLNLAVDKANLDVVEALLKRGANVNVTDEDDMTALCCAVERNDKMTVEFIIKKGANVRSENNKALFLAVEFGFADIVKILLKHGGNPNDCKSGHITALHAAVTKGHKHVVHILIENHAEVNISDDAGDTPLHLAARGGYREIVSVLLKNGAKPNIPNVMGQTALHCAVMSKSGNESIVDLLLKYSSNITLSDNKQRIPIELAVAHGCVAIIRKLFSESTKSQINMSKLLHIASENGNDEVIQLLITEGADVHFKNHEGCKAIHLAARAGFKNTVELLLRYGCHVNEVDDFSRSLLHYAVTNTKLVEFLLSNGASVNVTNSKGQTPLHIAASICKSKETVEMLLAHGAIFNARDLELRTPLAMAASFEISNVLKFTGDLFKSVKENKCDKIESLLKFGAIINSKDGDGNTPLHFTVWKNFQDIAKTLLHNNANINTVNSKGFTPLHYATKCSHLSMTKLLLLNGAIFDAKSVSGKSPVDMATDTEIIRIFKLITNMFHNVGNEDAHVLHELNSIKDIELVKVIMNARNSSNESLIIVAMRKRSNLVDHLKSILQENSFLKISEATRLIAHNSQKGLCILQSIYEERKKLFGTENPATLDVQELISKALYKLGFYEKAMEMCNDLLEKQSKIFGKSSKAALETEDTIALILHRMEKNEEAYEIYQKICPKLQDIAGSEDDSILEAELHMALVLHRLNKLDEALRLNQEIIRKLSNKYGVNHQLTVSAQNNIAMVLASQKKYEEAIEIYEQVYQKKKFIFGINHISTLNTKHGIGSVYNSQGNRCKAIEIWTELLAIQKQMLGPEHPVNLRVQWTLALALLNEGKYITAYGLFKEIVEFDEAKVFSNGASRLMTAIIESLHLIGDSSTIHLLHNHHDNMISAASVGNLAAIQELVEYSGDINRHDANGLTPLHHAVSNGHVEVVTFLLKHGADSTALTKKANTPLHLAVSRGFTNIVIELLKHTKDDKLIDFVNAPTGGTGTTALHIAAKNGYFEILVILLTHNAIYNVKNYQNKTPLEVSKEKTIQTFFRDIDRFFVSAKYGHQDMLEEIKLRNRDEIKAVLGTIYANKFTLLLVAINNNQKQMAYALVQLMSHVFTMQTRINNH